jgi:hypothetical protein
MSGRSTTDIAADIVHALRSLKRGVRNQEATRAVLSHIKIARDGGAYLAQTKLAVDIRKRAAKAAAALAALEKVLPRSIGTIDAQSSCETPRGGYDFASTREQIQHITGPHPRMDVLGWLCANQAFALVREVSTKPAGATHGGTVHMVALLIHEAATGKSGSDASLLKTIKRVKWWRGTHRQVLVR